jgi:hypothetical protein
MDCTVALDLLIAAFEVSEEMFEADWLPQAARAKHIKR